MKIIKPDANLIIEENPFKKVEMIGRLCYKSEDKITDTSYVKFVQTLINHKHYAMLEHGVVEFFVETDNPIPEELIALPYSNYIREYDDADTYIGYSVYVSLSHLYNPYYAYIPIFRDFRELLCATYCKDVDDITVCENDYIVCETYTGESNFAYKSITLKDKETIDPHYSIQFMCDRGVSHELVRHRCAVAQESTRYCDYTNAKFGSDMKFIEPADFNAWTESAKMQFKRMCEFSEFAYKSLRELDLTPQKSRAILIHALKTECVLTMPISQWVHFFNLRSDGTTGQPHPDMKVVADIAHKKLSDFLNGTYDN